MHAYCVFFFFFFFVFFVVFCEMHEFFFFKTVVFPTGLTERRRKEKRKGNYLPGKTSLSAVGSMERE